LQNGRNGRNDQTEKNEGTIHGCRQEVLLSRFCQERITGSSLGPEKKNPQNPPDLKKGAAPPVGKPAKMSGFLGSDTF
jgi:argininosuccinate lyase